MLGIQPPALGVLLDNTAMIEIMRTGRNLTMRHLSKTHGISVAWLHEQYCRDDVIVKYVASALMAADLCTKPFTNPSNWDQLCLQNNLFPHGPKDGLWVLFAIALETHDRAYQVLIASLGRGKITVGHTTPTPGVGAVSLGVRMANRGG